MVKGYDWVAYSKNVIDDDGFMKSKYISAGECQIPDDVPGPPDTNDTGMKTNM